MSDPLWDYIDWRLDRDEPRFIVEPEDLLDLSAPEREGTDRRVWQHATACDVTVDFIDASDGDTESATAGDTPLLRIAITDTDEITQRVKPAKE
jgi:hypothetical protein